MPTLREITLRHARHYEAELREAESLYIKGGTTLAEALEKFDHIRANVLAAQVWAETQAQDDQEAALLNVAYQNAAPASVRFAPAPGRARAKIGANSMCDTAFQSS